MYENTIDDLPINIIPCDCENISMDIEMDAIFLRVPETMTQHEIEVFLNKRQDMILHYWKKMHEGSLTVDDVKPFTLDELKELAKKASVVLPEKVEKYAAIMGVTYNKITIRRQRTRWGSCSDKGNLNFNCLLMLFPDEVVDYVVVHELSHRKHMNHSADFYAEIESVLPEYRSCQKWLKEHGRHYVSRLPRSK